MIFTKKDKKIYNNSSHCFIYEEVLDQIRIVSKGKAAHSSCGERDTYTQDVNWKEFYKTKDCSICGKSLDNIKVRDHCHLTGKFRGAAHNSCNLKYKIIKFFPVIFHNLAGYDSHLFIKNLGITKGKINCIPNNEEKYISFSKEIIVEKNEEVEREIRFIDSFTFMASSLAGLVNNLNVFENLREFFEGEKLELLKRKGVYPYDFMNRIEKLNETEFSKNFIQNLMMKK